MLWLVDIGNSRVKVALWRDGAATWRASLRSDPALAADDYYAALCAALPAGAGRGGGGSGGGDDEAVLASVVPALVPAWTTLLREQLGVAAVHRAGDLFAADPGLDWNAISHLGEDRAAYIAGARDAWGARPPGEGALIIVGFGTATTIDAWSPRDGYLGSAIACGLELAARALCEGTALLPAVELAPPPAAACRDEPGALRAGLVLGHAELVRGLLARFAAELGPPARVVATGGWAADLAPYVRAIDEVLPDLAFSGLAAAYASARRAGQGRRAQSGPAGAGAKAGC